MLVWFSESVFAICELPVFKKCLHFFSRVESFIRDVNSPISYFIGELKEVPINYIDHQNRLGSDLIFGLEMISGLRGPSNLHCFSVLEK